MSSEPTFIGTSPNGQQTFTIDEHENIPHPVFIPEVKWDEGFLSILNHSDALDHNNPIMVPAAAYEGLRTKRNIIERTNEDGKEIGATEVANLESEHPVLYFGPPELYNLRRTSTLKKYYFKGDKESKKEFESSFRDGNYDNALELVPKFQRAFFKANISRITEELSGASPPRKTKYDISSTDEAWNTLEKSDMEGYFSEIVADASGRSAAIIPPVPIIGRNPSDLVPALCSSNSMMAEVAGTENNPKSYFHLVIKHTALRPSGDDAGNLLLDIVRNELENEYYAGIALTIRNPHKIDAAGSLARTETFIQNICDLGGRFGIPVIAPRSGWLGTLATDNGLAGYSDLMNSAWEYRRDSSGIDEKWKKYGTLAAYGDAKPLVANPDDSDENIIEYVDNGKVTDLSNLPTNPPGDPDAGDTLEQKLGSARDFRIKFAKPRKLAHIYEAKSFREERQDGTQQPAREYLKDSDNPYIDV